MFTGTKLAAVLGAAALSVGIAASPAMAQWMPNNAARPAGSEDCGTSIHTYKGAAKAKITMCALANPGGTAYSASVKVSDTKTDGKCAHASVWVVGYKSKSYVKVSDCTKNGKASATARTGWWRGTDIKYLVWAS